MSNKQPQVTLIYNRRKKATTSKKGAVEVRISYNYKQKYISSGILLTTNQWKKGRVVNTPDAQQANQILDSLVSDIRQIILDMTNEGFINIQSISKRLKQQSKHSKSFLDFCKERAQIRKYGKSKDNIKRYDRFIKFFETWGNIIDVSDITESNIIKFDEYLSSKHLKDSSKWNCYHRFLNSFIADAIDEGYLYKNPYKKLSINKGRYEDALDRCLTYEEFQRIKNVKLPTERLERIRDVFVFQTYTCLSYSDLVEFKSSKIQVIDNTKVYTGNRNKTDKSFVIPLLPLAIFILEKYNYTLPIISAQKYNDYLKLVANAAGINKHISSHWARHTGATLLLNEGVDLKIISKICGHSSTKITEQIYAKLMDETVVKALKDINI